MSTNVNDMTHDTPFIGAGVGTEGQRDAAIGSTSGPSAAADATKDRQSAEDRKREREAKSKEAEGAENEAFEKRKNLDALRSKMADAGLSNEAREMRDAERAADDAMAKAAALRAQASGPMNPTVVGDVAGHPVAGTHPDMELGDHRAQRFGNIPENPKPAKGEHTDPKMMTTRMLLRTPNSAVPQEAWVHAEMVGDYARAGWELDATVSARPARPGESSATDRERLEARSGAGAA